MSQRHPLSSIYQNSPLSFGGVLLEVMFMNSPLHVAFDGHDINISRRSDFNSHSLRFTRSFVTFRLEV